MIATTDYELVTEAAGLFDRSARGKLVVSGADAAEFLQGQVTNDVEALASGEGCYAALLDHKGKIRADLRVLRGDDWIWLDTEPDALAAMRRMVRMYSIGREVSLEDRTQADGIVSLLGPASRAALDVAPPAAEHAFVRGEHGLYVSTDRGVDVICAAAELESVRSALGLPEVSEVAAECLRIESGRPRLGLDMDGATIPQEAGLNERAVSFTKGCYVGQETVARLFHRGKPNRHLRGLRLALPAAHGAELRLGERVVGAVGSSCVSPRHGPIALALVRREAVPGDIVAVGLEGASASVCELPFAEPA